ncbi:hypothetical protein LTR37_005651 [Vermiconidia calcicola]|uniref:Uncharacterized protein n=1 Tax=Vermiconidia calcicola TaxID=1690605 RepID=A0ACC3NJP2_9PEZI|nr:hypothetical protein LTR37_005651 [Vermiconidia calcicola]
MAPIDLTDNPLERRGIGILVIPWILVTIGITSCFGLVGVYLWKSYQIQRRESRARMLRQLHADAAPGRNWYGRRGAEGGGLDVWTGLGESYRKVEVFA